MTRIPFLVLLTGVVLAAQSCIAGEIGDIKSRNTFDAGKKICDALKQIAPDTGKPMFIREFRGLASSHVGLSKCIADELVAAGYSIKEGAPVELEGRMLRLPVRETEDLKGFTVRCTLNMDDGSQQNFSVDVENRDEGAVAVKETGEIHAPPTKPSGSDPSELPPAFESCEIKPAGDSPYGVEVLIEQGPGNYVPLKPFMQGKLIKCALPKGAIYAVRVHNRTPFEAAANVYIDGLSRYAMADDPAYRGGLDLIPANSHRDIVGYYRDGQQVDSFQIGEYSESAAAKLLPSTPDIGLICVSFAACWQGDKDPPGEPGKSKGVDPPGTKQGPKRGDPTSTVQRHVGQIRAIVKVSY
jgi:hypothetical protein